jgi:hypothetical protein
MQKKHKKKMIKYKEAEKETGKSVEELLQEGKADVKEPEEEKLIKPIGMHFETDEVEGGFSIRIVPH